MIVQYSQYNSFGLEDNKFYVDYTPTGPVENIKLECERRARELSDCNKSLILSLSTGLDSQVVLHSFCSQGLKIDTAFLYMEGYNDIEFQQLKILEKKYNFKCNVVEMDPMSIKDPVLEEAEALGVPPYHIIQKYFLKQLPEDANFIQGLEGPYVTLRNGKHCFIESFNSYEKARIRALSSLDRTGEIISWERCRVLSSILQDPIFQGYMCASNYIINNGLVHKTNQKNPSVLSRWDLYIKPILYGNYWKNELEYFPKNQGPEKIEYIINGPVHDFKRMITIPIDDLITHFTKDTTVLRLYENDTHNTTPYG